MTLPHTLLLAGRTPLASGSTRDVYLHPEDSDLLIKIIRKDAIEKRYGSGRPWYKRDRRYRHFISYLRELREEIAVQAQCGGQLLSLQKIVGFADTDLGFGLVVAAARDRHGNLAPTLPQLIADGRYDATVKADLKTCMDELLASPVILADVHGANLVYAWREDVGNHFVLIDGIGCKTLIPLNRMNRLINRYAKRRRIDRLWINLDKLIARTEAARPTDSAHQTQPLPQAAE